MAINAQQAIREFEPALARVATFHERNSAARDELIEEIYLAIAASLARRGNPSGGKSFLFRIAHNRATSYAQQLPRASRTTCECARDTPQLDEIGKLSLPRRLTITLLFENFGESEIAEVLGLPVERVAAHIEGVRQQFGVHFDELRNSWLSQQAEVRVPRRWPRIRSRWPNILSVMQIVCATAGALTGIWLAYMAWRLASLSSGVWAVVLLVTAPPLGILAFLARKDDLKWECESPGSVLVSGGYRSEASLLAIRLGRGYIFLVGSHIAVLWVSQLGELISARAFLELYTGIWAGIALAYLPWLSRCERRVYEERANTRRLLGELTSAESL